MSNTGFQKRVLMVAVGAAALAACAPDVSREEMAKATEGYIEDTNKLFVVDCLLPGQVRKLGSQMSYISQRRPIRTTAADCEVRGGEYVAYDRANYASALKVWLPKAQEGDAEAQNYVGQVFEKGLGQSADYQAASQWYQKAAEQGNAQAQLNLGHLYEKGLGVAQDMAAANRWYRKAAGLESANLQFTPALSETPVAPVQPRTQDREIESLRREAEKSRQEAEQSRMEAEQSRQEAARLRHQLFDSQKQVVDQQETLRKAQEEMEAARLLREQAASSQADDAAQRRLEEQLRQKEAQLKAQQDRLTTMTSALNEASQSRREAAELRGQLAEAQQQLSGQQQTLLKAQEELEETRRKISQERASPAKPDDAALRQLEEELRQKQAQLTAQQSKVAAMTASLSKERQAVKHEAESVHRHAAPRESAPVQSVASEGERGELAQAESVLSEKINQYQKNSSELTAWLTGSGSAGMDRDRIDQRKRELLAQAKEISALREKLEQQGSKLADQEQPGALKLAAGPRIEILDPPLTLTRGMPSIQITGGDRRKEIVGRINAQDGLSSLIINDRPQSVDPSGIFRTPVNVAGEPTQIKIVATDKKNRHSDLIVTLVGESGVKNEAYPASVSKQEGEVPKDVEFGQFYALIIGNADYKAYSGLKTPVNDAKSVELILRERYGFKTKLLINANRHQIMTALNEMNKRLGGQDNFLIYYAGHGEIDKATQSAYWLPTDAEVGNSANWISSQSITEYLGIMAARHVMVVADSCYSGALTGSAIARLPEGMDESKRAKWLKVMNSRKARTVLTSGGVQPVLDQGGGDHSIFANAFLRVLRGNKKAVLEDYDLFRDVSNQVSSAAARVGFQQSPQYAPLQHAGHEGSPFFFVPGVGA